MKKKILMVCEAFGGGVFTYVSQLCNDMVDNFDIYLAYSLRPQTPENYKEFLSSQVHMVEMKYLGAKGLLNIFNDIKTFKELRDLEIQIKPDIIHLHSSIAGGMGRLAYGGRYNTLIYTPHGYAHILMGSGMKSFIYHKAEKILGQTNCVTLTCCESEDEVARDLCKKTAYIETGMNIREISALLDGVKPVKNEKFTVFTLGRICVQKQPQLFDKIAKLVPEARFIWIGSGELENQLTAPNVEIIGWKSRKEALAMAKGADIFILCSLGEAVAMSLIESMYMKKLILVSNAMGNRSVIRNGINGYVCESAEEYAEKMPVEAIEAILHKNGINAYSEIYLSSRYMATKANGELYKYILADLKNGKKDLIHLGDNFKSDCLVSGKLGVPSILIRGGQYKDCPHYSANGLRTFLELENYKNLCSFIYNHLGRRKSRDNTDFYFEVGYETLGPLLNGFCQWLNQNLINSHISRVFFLSRDGKLIQRACQIRKSGCIEEQYIYVSRRALIVPTLWKCHSLQEVVDTMYFQKRGTIKSFLKRVGLEPDKQEARLRKYGYGLCTIYVYKTLFDEENFGNFFQEVLGEIVSNSKREYDLLVSYLRQINFRDCVAIVDIGWNGNIQKALQKVCEYAGINVHIHGFYVGINPFAGEFVKKHTAKGYLFYPGYKEYLYELQRNFTALFEIFFTADHGSVLKYQREGQYFHPELLPFEYQDDMETKQDFRKISMLQEGAICFMEDIKKAEYFMMSAEPEIAFQNFINLGIRPNKLDVDMFGDFVHFDDDIVSIASPKTITRYLGSPRSLLDDLSKNPNIWKMGFLKRMLKINFPYYRLFRVVKRIAVICRNTEKGE